MPLLSIEGIQLGMIERHPYVAAIFLTQLGLQLVTDGFAVLPRETVDHTRFMTSGRDILRHHVNRLAILLPNFVGQIWAVEGAAIQIRFMHAEDTNGVLHNLIVGSGGKRH